MSAPGCRKKENLRRSVSAAELRLEKAIKAAMSEVRGADGKPPSRAIARILYDEQKPAGMLGRRLVEMRAARSPFKSADRVLAVIRDWLVNDLYENAHEQHDQPDQVA
ncbi:MAG: hypothetical protein JWM41_2930 [Gemmatimonadetes bacterium]|nr:hypothetical protein [Gemmatimonadota bacterium]